MTEQEELIAELLQVCFAAHDFLHEGNIADLPIVLQRSLSTAFTWLDEKVGGDGGDKWFSLWRQVRDCL